MQQVAGSLDGIKWNYLALGSSPDLNTVPFCKLTRPLIYQVSSKIVSIHNLVTERQTNIQNRSLEKQKISIIYLAEFCEPFNHKLTLFCLFPAFQFSFLDSYLNCSVVRGATSCQEAKAGVQPHHVVPLEPVPVGAHQQGSVGLNVPPAGWGTITDRGDKCKLAEKKVKLYKAFHFNLSVFTSNLNQKVKQSSL